MHGYVGYTPTAGERVRSEGIEGARKQEGYGREQKTEKDSREEVERDQIAERGQWEREIVGGTCQRTKTIKDAK